MQPGTLNEAMGIEDIKCLRPSEWPYIHKQMGPAWDDENVQFFVSTIDYTGDREIIAAVTDMWKAILPRPEVHTTDLDESYEYTKEFLLRRLKNSTIERGLRLVDVLGVDFDVDILIHSPGVDRPVIFLPPEMFSADVETRAAEGRFYKPYDSTLYEVLNHGKHD